MSPVEMPNPKPSADNAESSEGGERQNTGTWFRRILQRGSRNRTRRQKLPEESPDTGASREKAPLPNKTSSTIAPGQRIRVSLPLSPFLGRVSNQLAQRVVMWMGDERPVRSFVIGLLIHTDLLLSTGESDQKTRCVE